WVKVAGGVLVGGFFVWQAWPFFFSERPRAQPVVTVTPAPAPVQRVALAPAQDWRGAFDQARSALNESRLADAEGLFRQSLAFVEKEHGAEHPAAGVVLHQLALTYERRQRPADQEATLKRALAVFERHRPREAKAALGTLGNFVDKENVARYLGDMYWDRRNYGESFVYFRKAHDAALEVDVEPEIRNMKRAYTSAGVMKTACMIGQWAIADDAMAELKRRYPTVSASTQRYLKYWIETGEPRLQARRC
ncbi:MAG TPA: tetratricopeptide repeat protein, partial [Burkholderiales bacterium]|nr:tetratricopeptide repeat protein [Burkholderiales bacterium]